MQVGKLTDFNGNLLIQGANVVSYSDISAISVVDVTPFATGQLAYVQTLRRYFKLDKSSTTATISGEVISATTGRWLAVPIPDLSWQCQDSWFINASTGNDENDGLTLGTAIRTYREFTRRVSFGSMWQISNARTVLVTQVGDCLSTDLLNLSVFVDNDSTLEFAGAYTTARTGTFTATSATNAASNIQAQVEDTVNGVWTSYVNPATYLFTPVLIPSSNASFVLDKDLGSGVAQVTDTRTLTIQTASWVTPSVGDTYVVPTLPLFPSTVFRSVSTGTDPVVHTSPANLIRRVTFSYFRFSRSTSIFNDCINSSIQFRVCQITQPTLITLSSFFILRGGNSGAYTFTACSFGGYISSYIDSSSIIIYASVIGMYYNTTWTRTTATFFGTSIQHDMSVSNYSTLNLSSSSRTNYLNYACRIRAESYSKITISGTTCGPTSGSADLFRVNQGSDLLAVTGFVMHATGTTNQVTLDAQTSLLPTIDQWSGSVPSASACNTFAQLAAAPFNGTAMYAKTRSRMRIVTSTTY